MVNILPEVTVEADPQVAVAFACWARVVLAWVLGDPPSPRSFHVGMTSQAVLIMAKAFLDVALPGSSVQYGVLPRFEVDIKSFEVTLADVLIT